MNTARNANGKAFRAAFDKIRGERWSRKLLIISNATK